jgi:hypothetical protein
MNILLDIQADSCMAAHAQKYHLYHCFLPRATCFSLPSFHSFDEQDPPDITNHPAPEL